MRVLSGLLTAFFVCVLVWVDFGRTQAQETIPVLPGNVSNGLNIYRQRCANCHGILGEGDGELAQQAVSPPPPIGTANYTRAAIPTVMYEAISNGRVQNGMPPFGDASSDPLLPEERWDVIAALYALGTTVADVREGANYYDPALFSDIDWANTPTVSVSAMLAEQTELTDAQRNALADTWRMSQFDYLLDAGLIEGQVFNGTTGQPATELTINLTAFEGFEIVETFESLVDDRGNYRFSIDNVPPDWIFRLELIYADLEYAGDLFQFTPDTLARSESLTVFDTTTDDAGLLLDQLHVVVELGPDTITLNEFYSYSNNASTIYAGNVPFNLPAGASEPTFLVLTGAGQFAPATGVVQTATGWEDTQPVSPGAGAMGMLVRYTLPYGGDLSVAHPLDYTPADLSVVVPDGIGVSGNGWTQAGVDEIQGERFVNYRGVGSETLNMALSGASAFAVDPATGSRIKVRDTSQELLIGGVALLAAIGACVYATMQWQQPDDPQPLLQEIATLDDAFAAGEVKRKAYEQQRKRLLQQVRDVW